MKLQRFIALVMLMTVSAAFGYISRDFTYPIILCCVAALGLAGRLQLKLAPARQTIVMLLLAVIFTVKYRFIPENEDSQVSGFIVFSFVRTVAQYFIMLMTLYFFLPRKNNLKIGIVLCGMVVLLCAGDVMVNETEEKAYRIFSLLYVSLAAIYCGLCRTFAPGRRDTSVTMRRIIAGTVLGGALVAGCVASWTIYRYQRYATSLLTGFDPFSTTGRSVNFTNRAVLDGLARTKQTDANRIALRIFSDSKAGYLRARTFDNYKNSTWRLTGKQKSVHPSKSLTDNPPIAGNGNVFRIHDFKPYRVMDVWPSPEIALGTFTPRGTTLFRAAVDAIAIDENNAIDALDLPGGLNYTLAVADLIPPETLSDEQRKRCLFIEENLDQRIRQLAKKIFAGCETPARKILAVENYFRENYEYHLGLAVPRQHDPLTYFLIEKPPAHCEYFATGSAILLRLADVPTRYVTGFVAVEPSRTGGGWIARNRDAHAWVEAWDREKRQWILVEATPPGGLPSGEPPNVLADFWEYVKFRFQELRVAMFINGFAGLGRWLWGIITDLLALLITTIPGLLISALLLFVPARRIWRKIRRRKHSRQSISPRVAALHRLLKQMDHCVAKHGLKRAQSETLHQFATRIQTQSPPETPPDKFAAWYIQYAQARYNPHTQPANLNQLKNSIPV